MAAVGNRVEVAQVSLGVPRGKLAAASQSLAERHGRRQPVGEAARPEASGKREEAVATVRALRVLHGLRSDAEVSPVVCSARSDAASVGGAQQRGDRRAGRRGVCRVNRRIRDRVYLELEVHR